MKEKEFIELLTVIHKALDKHPLKGFGLAPESWKKLSEVTGIKWPRDPLTEEEMQERNKDATNNNQS